MNIPGTRRLLIMICTVLAVGLLASCQPREETTAEDQQQATESLDDLRSRWEEAYRAGDLDGLMEMWSEEGVLMPPSRPSIAGTEAIRQNYEFLFKNYQVTSFDLHPEETRIVGDWAFERGTIQAQLTPKGGSVQLTDEAKEALAGSEALESPETEQVPEVAFVRSDLGGYMAVLHRESEEAGWKLFWVIGNNLPEEVVVAEEEAEEGQQ